MPELYGKAVRYVNQKVGPSTEEIKERREKKEQEYRKKKSELKKIEEELNKLEMTHGKESRNYKKKKKEHDKKKKRLEKVERKFKDENFKRKMKFLDLDLKKEHILTFSIFMGLLTFLFSLIALFVLVKILELGIFQIVVFGAPSLTILPCSIILLASYYPDIAYGRVKKRSLGKLPETVNYMTMSLRVNPSLSKAITFASENADEPISTSLKKVIWRVYMNENTTLEDSFLKFAYRWGEWNRHLKRSLYAVRSSLLEKTEDGFRNSLERANKLIIEGTKQDMKKFSESLRTPTTVLFALGILLPLIIGAMLPMMALAGLDISALTTEVPESESYFSLPFLIILMNGVFPLIAFIYSYHIVGQKPGMKSPLKFESEVRKRPHLIMSAILLVVGLLLISFGEQFFKEYMPIPYFFVVVIPISYYFLVTSVPEKKKREKLMKMEKEFPNLLFQLGSRIAEGLSLERAFLKSTDTLKDAEITQLVNKINKSIKMSHQSLESSLFGEEGILKEHPSRSIRSTMKTVIKISEKDPETAGKSIMRIANYKEELQQLDEEMKNMLSKNIQMMKGTALIFAPFTMGILASLYYMLEDIFTGLGSVELVSPVAFSSVMGVYLLLMGAVITYFTKSIESSLDILEFKYEYGKTMLISITIYSVALLLGRLLIVNL